MWFWSSQNHSQTCSYSLVVCSTAMEFSYSLVVCSISVAYLIWDWSNVCMYKFCVITDVKDDVIINEINANAQINSNMMVGFINISISNCKIIDSCLRDWFHVSIQKMWSLYNMIHNLVSFK